MKNGLVIFGVSLLFFGALVLGEKCYKSREIIANIHKDFTESRF